MFGWLQKRRRSKVLARPFPQTWRDILEQRVRHYSQLSEPMRRRIEDCVALMVEERTFEGVGGLTLNDDVRVTIAGQAALLLLGVEGYYFDRVPTILVYPESYVRPGGPTGGMVVDEEQEYAGEAWAGGPIVLSWRDVVRGGQHLGDGSNVVLHEFAHHLDGLDGEMGGSPPMPNRQMSDRWAKVIDSEYIRLVQAVRRGEPTLLDDYGATNKAEFFAVSTETFFEMPRDLQIEHPDWYEVLSDFYRLDTAQWDWT